MPVRPSHPPVQRLVADSKVAGRREKFKSEADGCEWGIEYLTHVMKELAAMEQRAESENDDEFLALIRDSMSHAKAVELELRNKLAKS